MYEIEIANIKHNDTIVSPKNVVFRVISVTARYVQLEREDGKLCADIRVRLASWTAYRSF